MADPENENSESLTRSSDHGTPADEEDTSRSSEHESTAEREEEETSSEEPEEITYVLNTNTKKFHQPYCSSVQDIKDKNKKETTQSREEIISQGYKPCKRCNP